MKITNFGLALVLCCAGCGGSGGSDFEIWRGNLQFFSSVCDIILSDPPAIDPADPITLQVRRGAVLGDSARVVDDELNGYDGTMTSADSFDVAPDADSDPDTAASIITFSNINGGTAEVEELFQLNGPHGCAHRFRGTFALVP